MEMNYALVALDMDGTLLNSRHEISQYTRTVIRRAMQAGKYVVLSTGRTLSELAQHIDELGGVSHLICENGALVYDVRAQRAISRTSIEHDKVEAVMRLSEDAVALIQFFMENQSYVKARVEDDLSPYNMEEFRPVFELGSLFEPDLFGRYLRTRASVDKINLYFATREGRSAFRRKAESLGLTMAETVGIGLELSPPGASKGRGLKMLCEHLAIGTEKAIAIGDGDNDLDIVRAAGLGVAMGNAVAALKAAADAVTEDNDHDGAAKAIETYMKV